MKFATLHDVARSAGVSYATVDRVVNDRGGVADKSALRVQEAIKRLRYERDESAANLARKRIYRFHFLLPDDNNDFFCALDAALRSHKLHSNLLRTRVRSTRVPAFSEDAIIAALDAVDATITDCVCLVALDTPKVVSAIARARQRGLKIVTLVSDVASTAREHYVGIDNLVAGKTAGRVMGLAHSRRAGCVLPIFATDRAFDHTQRLDGFREILQNAFPQVDLLPAIESHDDATTIHQVLTEAQARHPDLTGVYNIGAGNIGLIDWVRHIPAHERPIMVIHELLPCSRAALEAGLVDAVIDQKPYAAVGQALRVMRQLVDGKSTADEAQVITPAIYLCDNLPPLPAPHDGSVQR